MFGKRDQLCEASIVCVGSCVRCEVVALEPRSIIHVRVRCHCLAGTHIVDFSTSSSPITTPNNHQSSSHQLIYHIFERICRVIRQHPRHDGLTKDAQIHYALCRNTTNTAEYAAAAARLSNGLATVVKAIRPRKSTMKPVITPSLALGPFVPFSTQRGTISISIPMMVMVMPMELSIFASDE